MVTGKPEWIFYSWQMRLKVRKKNCPPLLNNNRTMLLKIIIIITIELLRRRLLCHCLMGKMIYKFLFFIYIKKISLFGVGGSVKKSLRVLLLLQWSHKGQKTKKKKHHTKKLYIPFHFFFPYHYLYSFFFFLSLVKQFGWNPKVV